MRNVPGGTSAKRMPALPEVPTMKSLGYDVVAASWTGIVAPAGTPESVVETLTRAVRKVIETPEHQAKLEQLALQPRYLDPAAYRQLWTDTETRMKPILQSIQPK